jgi:hypothetical protein
MLSKLLCGAALASAAAGASAQTWNFNYSGFNFLTPNGQQQFLPDATIDGSFSGTDRNGDGAIAANELTSFIVHSFWNNDTEFTRCAQDFNVYSACALDAFSFGPQDQLAFKVHWNGGDNGYNASWYGNIESGVWETIHTSYTTPGNTAATNYAVAWQWSDQTRLTIAPAPVPEPSQAALMLMGLAGLLTLGLAAQRLSGAKSRMRFTSFASSFLTIDTTRSTI